MYYLVKVCVFMLLNPKSCLLFVGWLYVLEMAFKIYAYGFVNYWRDGQNQFDFVITWVIG